MDCSNTTKEIPVEVFNRQIVEFCENKILRVGQQFVIKYPWLDSAEPTLFYEQDTKRAVCLVSKYVKWT